MNSVTDQSSVVGRSHPAVIDVWANYWPQELFSAYPKLADLYARAGIKHRMGLSVDDLIEEADAGGVGTVLLSSAEFAGSPSTNAALARVIDAHSDRLLGCGSLDPRRVDARDEVFRCVEKFGFRAIKIIPFFSGVAPDDPVYFSTYSACQELGIPVFILTGHTAVKEPSRFGQPLRIDEIALAFPSLVIVAGHAGYPWTEELISIAWKHENVYIETSGHRPRHWPQPLVQFLSTYGSKSVMFGSGFPMLSYQDLLGDLEEMDIRPGSRDALLWDNAARVLSLETL